MDEQLGLWKSLRDRSLGLVKSSLIQICDCDSFTACCSEGASDCRTDAYRSKYQTLDNGGASGRADVYPRVSTGHTWGADTNLYHQHR